MLIKQDTKWLGDPCRSDTKAYRFNRVVEDFLRFTRITRFARWLDETLSVRRHGQFTCSRRNESWLSSEKTNGDYWQKRGKDLCCSYCGSMKPDQFLAHCQQVVEDPDMEIRVGSTDKKYKYYVERPKIRNASYGAIKFYMHHAPMHATLENNYDHSFIDKLNAAVGASNAKFQKLLNHRDTRFQ